MSIPILQANKFAELKVKNTYANHYYELCVYTCFHIIILFSDDGSGNCRNMLVLKLRSVIISVQKYELNNLPYSHDESTPEIFPRCMCV